MGEEIQYSFYLNVEWENSGQSLIGGRKRAWMDQAAGDGGRNCCFR
jgi:hypothetical protein